MKNKQLKIIENSAEILLLLRICEKLRCIVTLLHLNIYFEVEQSFDCPIRRKEQKVFCCYRSKNFIPSDEKTQS